ncbi:MAG: hypothetical protein WBA57_11745 [Elainellaceae cyanobacterium]
MKLSFRGVIYESPFPTLELTRDPAESCNHGVLWRFQQLKAVRDNASQNGANDSEDNEGTVLLAIWEPAQTTETRTRPFLFVVKHLLKSEEEARNTLESYLKFYAQNPAPSPPRVFVGTREMATCANLPVAKEMSY